MENKEKEIKKQNKEAMRAFEKLTIAEQIDFVNNALKKVDYDTNALGDVAEFSYTWVRGILAKNSVYYIASLKRFVMTNPFTTEEVAFFKSLYENKDNIVIGFKAETDEDTTLEGAVNRKIGSSKEVSQNRSFYISDSIFFHFKAFCNIQKSVANKQLMELALVVLMEKFPVDKTELEIAYQEVLKENERMKNEILAKKKEKLEKGETVKKNDTIKKDDEAVNEDIYCD
ncbi:hypothetical protein ACUH7Y_00860 [Clostridium beijerinckii]|uniref:Uncharacterized protein n=1 Tax=Clostridium beijerinckii TaxID=1520 RepID=A0A7X9XR57_CLOBE|nr:hypothetical protein [Clostridium beijerinckii]NMF06875.1 hypothetical protein [Clostridium beijerinckii]